MIATVLCSIATFLLVMFLAPRLADMILRNKLARRDETFQGMVERIQSGEQDPKWKEVTENWVKSQIGLSKKGELTEAQVNTLVSMGILDKNRVSYYENRTALEEKYTYNVKHSVRAAAATYVGYLAAMLGLYMCGHVSVAMIFIAIPLAFLYAVAVMIDVKAHIIPNNITAIITVLAILWWAIGEGIFYGFNWKTLIATAVVTIVFVTIDLITKMFLKKSIGMGDLKIIPSICLISGYPGMLIGCVACLLVMLIAFVVRTIQKNKSMLPMAPGLAVWCVVGLAFTATPIATTLGDAITNLLS